MTRKQVIFSLFKKKKQFPGYVRGAAWLSALLLSLLHLWFHKMIIDGHLKHCL